ncbi:MAG: T9SS type A sorting domain-containing protein [Bacteroidetes bacterium]|nr:T9SS type A sorting domain-containing protein [Bacteroidota bacterium]
MPKQKHFILLGCLLLSSALAWAQNPVPNHTFEDWKNWNTQIPSVWQTQGTPARVAGKSGGYAIRLQNTASSGEMVTIYQGEQGPGFGYTPGFAYSSAIDSVRIVYRSDLKTDTASMSVGFTSSADTFPLYFSQYYFYGNSGGWKTITLPLEYINLTPGLVPDSGYLFIESADPLDGASSDGYIEIDEITFIKAGNSNMPKIPENGFDNWTTNSVEYPAYWGTSHLASRIYGLSGNYSARSTDAHSGSAAVKVQGFSMNTMFGTDTFPGMVATMHGETITDYEALSPDFPSISVNQRYASVRGYIKSQILSGDRAVVWVNFFHKDTIVGSAMYTDTGSHSSYVSFSEDISWDSSFTGKPDSATVVLYVTDSLFSKVIHLNSWALFDDLQFDYYQTRTRPAAHAAVETRVYPNPTRDKVWLQTRSTETGNGTMLLQSLDGRLIEARAVYIPVGVANFAVNLTGMPSGTYLLHLHTAGGVQTQKILFNP